MMTKKCFFIILCLFSGNSIAGIMPSQSRIIYEAKDKEKSLMLANTNDYPVIVQTWIDTGEGTPDKKDIPFISIPPVFRLDSSAVKGVRIIYNQTKLPQDKESLFWFNIYEIPPERKSVNPENSVLVTMNTQMKLFYRPKGVTITPEQAMEKVTCQIKQDSIFVCSNPTPIHLSVVSVQLKNGNNLTEDTLSRDLMLMPFSQKEYQFRKGGNLAGSMIFHYIDDSGNQHEYSVNRS